MNKHEIQTINNRFNYGLRRISDRLFYARIKAKLTQEDMAKIRNITAKTVKRWETRHGAPKNQNLIMELAEIYNISYPWLSFHYGNEEYDFEQVFEPEYINDMWHSLDREKQKTTVIYLQKLMA
jgi:transcriptional regulator with XRE-family HTH domain